jgi:integrase
VLGKMEIVRSLRTASHKEAVARLHLVSVEVDRLFREAAKPSPVQPVSKRVATEAEIVGLVRTWFWRRLRYVTAQERANGPHPDPDEALHDIEIELSIFSDPDDPNSQAAAWSGVHEIEKEHKLTIPEGSPVRSLAEDLVRRAIIEEYVQHRNRLNGDHRGIITDPLFAGLDPTTPPPKAPPLLSQVMADFVAEKASKWDRKTRKRYRADFDRFLAVTQDKPITQVTGDDARQFKKVIARLPANVTKLREFRRLSPVAAAEKAARLGRPPAADRTINQAIGNVTALFNWSVDNGILPINPMPSGLKVRINKSAIEERDPFRTEHLTAIFNAPIYTGCRSEHYWGQPGNTVLRASAKFWLPIIALYTGARLTEIAQLLVDDVKTEDSITYFNITNEQEGQRVKTRAGKRRVPVHDMLIDIGLLDHVEMRRARGEPRLFPDVRPGSDGYLSSRFSKWFGRFLDSVGIASPTLVFHSFRHSFKNALAAADVAERTQDWLMGHEDDDKTGKRYGSRELVLMHDAVRRVRFPGLDLDHIRPMPSGRRLEID